LPKQQDYDILYHDNTLLMGITMAQSIMNTNTRLGHQERLFLTSIAAEGKRIIHFADALPYWTSAHQTRKALSRLERKGWLRRLERGLYLLIPLEAGPDGKWSEDPLVIANQLVPDGATAYWSALHYWNMTEQVPRTVFVQTVARRNTPYSEILGVRYKFVTIKQNRFFGILSQTVDGMAFNITDREKTIVDSLARPDLSGGIMLLADSLGSVNGVDWHKLDNYLERFGSGAVYKRLGYLIEHLDVYIPNRHHLLTGWLGRLTHGIAWLEPGGDRTGPVKTRWRIRVNVKGLESEI
jgi:predicted transcriptional regulator of viral defense system